MIHKKSKTQKVNVLWLHLYEVPELTKLSFGKRNHVCPGAEEEGVSERDYEGTFWGGNVLHLN